MTKSQEEKFWATQRPESRIKALLVSNYFPQYCRIIYPKSKGAGFTYVDFWAGRGKYNDGGLSTPLLLGDIIAKDEVLKKIVTFAFNDLNNIEILKNNFRDRYLEGTFTQVPFFLNLDVTNSPQIKNYLNRPAKKDNNPALLFFDPYGYEGIDTVSLANFLKPFGNELFLFLNVNRVLPALVNPKMTEHIAAIFPKHKDESIREIMAEPNNEKRVMILLKQIAKEYRTIVGDRLYHCAFRFMESGANKTSHLIIHFCKNVEGYKLVKQVFSEYDNIGATFNQDNTFTFDAKKAYPTGVLDFTFDDNHINLAKELFELFAGQELSALSLMNKHHEKNPSSPYAPKHYTNALRLLHSDGKVSATFTDDIEHRVSVLLTDACKLKFNPK